MKRLLALLLFAALPAHAIIIDIPGSLTFDLFWGQNDSRWGMPFHFDNGTRGQITDQGTALIILSQMSANPYMFVVEIHPPERSLWSNFMVTFQGWQQNVLHPNIPDAVWGTDTAPWISRDIPADHLFAVPGNDHAVRVVIGALPVPESGSTAIMLGFATGALLALLWGRKP